MRDKGLCVNCVRYHPRGAANCVWAKSWMATERKHEYKLAVVECAMYLEPKEVFKEEVNAQPTKREKTGKTGNKKIDEDESKV